MLKNVRISVKIISMGVVITLLFALLLTWMYPMFRNRLYSEKRMKTREIVEASLGVVEYFAKEAKSGRMTKEAAQKAALATLETERYSGSEYMFVLNDEPRMLMHPIKKEMNGTLVGNEKDPNGKMLFVEMVSVAKKDGAGYVDYEWPKPGISKPVPKMSYVKLFPEWGWIVGTGIYLDDVAADLAQILRVLLIVSAGICAIALLISIYVTLNLNGVIGGLLKETKRLIDASAEGRLDVRGSVENIHFEFHGIINGINDMLDGVIGPLNVAAEYVDRISNGDIPPTITDSYNGDFNEIKNNLNKCIDAVNLLVADTNTLSKAATEGKLATRADAMKHQGDFRKIVQGINDTMDAVVGPLNIAAEYVDRISEGDVPQKITDNYQGDFNEIKNNLNKCIDGLGGLVEANMVLQRMAVNDHSMSVTGQYRGVFAEVGKAVNDVSTRVKHVVSSLSKVANGDLSDLEDYQKIGKRSENDELVPALRQMMENLQALVVDSEMLARMAIEGKLATRADVSKHYGEYRKIVQGFNETLDAVILPVNEAAEVLVFVAQNDLTKLVKGDYKGDHAKIKESLNTAVGNLNSVMAQVVDAVSQVGSASQQISSSAQGVAEGTAEQASSLEEVSSSLEEMSGMTKRNAENAVQAQSLSKSANDSAEKGKIAMQRMNAAIEDIKNSSDKTAKIVKTIDEIAFQTNLLALNAAVEAARAGEAGKGFAVVAEEVRNLAMRSAEAAKETAKMIEESVKNSDNGVKIADEVGKSLLEIADGAGKVNNLVAEIAAASKEQAQGIDQVNIAMGQMDKVTQANASSAEESASAAEELSSQASQLSDVVAAFVISRNGKGEAKQMSDLFSGNDLSLLKSFVNQAKAQKQAHSSTREHGDQRKLAGVSAGNARNGGKQKPEVVIPMDEDDYKDF